MGDHHPQPGAPALAEGHYDDVGALQLVELLDAPQFAFGLEYRGFRLAPHAPVQPLARKLLVDGLQPLPQILQSEVQHCSPP
jgi:hypothetical protein